MFGITVVLTFEVMVMLGVVVVVIFEVVVIGVAVVVMFMEIFLGELVFAFAAEEMFGSSAFVVVIFGFREVEKFADVDGIAVVVRFGFAVVGGRGGTAVVVIFDVFVCVCVWVCV